VEGLGLEEQERIDPGLLHQALGTGAVDIGHRHRLLTRRQPDGRHLIRHKDLAAIARHEKIAPQTSAAAGGTGHCLPADARNLRPRILSLANLPELFTIRHEDGFLTGQPPAASGNTA